MDALYGYNYRTYSSEIDDYYNELKCFILMLFLSTTSLFSSLSQRLVISSLLKSFRDLRRDNYYLLDKVYFTQLIDRIAIRLGQFTFNVGRQTARTEFDEVGIRSIPSPEGVTQTGRNDIERVPSYAGPIRKRGTNANVIRFFKVEDPKPMTGAVLI